MNEVTIQDIVQRYAEYGMQLGAHEVQAIYITLNTPAIGKAEKLRLLQKYIDDTFLGFMQVAVEKAQELSQQPEKSSE